MVRKAFELWVSPAFNKGLLKKPLLLGKQ